MEQTTYITYIENGEMDYVHRDAVITLGDYYVENRVDIVYFLLS